MDARLWERLNVDETALVQLRAFVDLVTKWTVRINLVAKSTLPEVWERHVEDSARLWLCAPPQARLWADFGSGGGFPGIVLAILAQSKGAGTRFILVESDQRKATFLREAARQLGLAVDVRSERAETIAPVGADVVSARALASLDALCAVAERHLGPTGTAIFPKGETFEAEIAEARKNWRFDLETVTEAGHKGAILCLRSIERVAS